MIRGNPFLTSYRLFRAFKYTIYLLLVWVILLLLFAFIFIELNIFQWHDQTMEDQSQGH